MGSHGTESTRNRAAGRPAWVYILVALVIGILAFVIGILIGRFAVCHDEDPSQPDLSAAFQKLIREADPEIADLLREEIDNRRIEAYLKNITVKPHIAGEDADFDLVQHLARDMRDFGLDSVSVAPYHALLSYPDKARPNSVQLLLGPSLDLVFDSRQAESSMSSLEGVVPPFHAYSPAKELTGDLVYVNYGRVEDYAYLATNASINVTGKIVIVRYGKIFRGSKVEIADRHGAKGIIIYSDPKDYTSADDPRVFPDTVWLPSTAAQRGTIFNGDGDPLTPGYPATRRAYRFSENETEVPLPGIPSHPIGYGAAYHFMANLQGEEVPVSWRGGMNFTYRFGPLQANYTVRMNITTKNDIRKVENVIGIITGETEPDRYVLMGNHRDAWVNGAIDPSSGTAVMMEVARAFGQLVKQGKWRPRRSIMFCSWGAEEYGGIGSTEWAEQYVKTLGARAVAYINIDIAVEGNYSLSADGTPLMYKSVYEAAKKTPNPKVYDPKDTRPNVYDVWKDSFPSRENLPRIDSLGSGSDYAPILQIAGITSVDLRFQLNSNQLNVSSYALYHTEYETFDTVKRLFDQEFKCHQAVGRVAGEMIRSLADSLIIPFNVSDYARGLEVIRTQLDRDYGPLLQQNIANYSDLEWSIQQFANDVRTFEQAIHDIDKNDPLAVRRVNDQLMLLEKAFLHSEGLPSRPRKKHLIWAENSNDAYAGSSFPGLVDLLFEINNASSSQWAKVHQHFAAVVNAIQTAGFTLRDVVRFVEEHY